MNLNSKFNAKDVQPEHLYQAMINSLFHKISLKKYDEVIRDSMGISFSDMDTDTIFKAYEMVCDNHNDIIGILESLWYSNTSNLQSLKKEDLKCESELAFTSGMDIARSLLLDCADFAAGFSENLTKDIHKVLCQSQKIEFNKLIIESKNPNVPLKNR